MLKKAILCLSLLAGPSVLAAHQHPETYYQRAWCTAHGGQTEIRLPDKTRADCELASHIIEFDYAPHFYQAVGQSLYYSLQTGKPAGIVLILESPKDDTYWFRLNSLIQYFHLPITTWQITPAMVENPHQP